MRKVLTISGVCIGISAVVGVVLYLLFRTGILDFKKVDNITVYEYTSEDGLIYTEAEWDWRAVENKEPIVYVKDTHNVAKTNVHLNLTKDLFYDVTIPNVPIIYDFGKTIWAEDGSFIIRVVGNANLNNLSALAGIDNGVNINKLTIANSEESKGHRVIATCIEDWAIIADVYSGNETFSIICDSIANNRSSYVVDDVNLDSANKVDEITYSGNYCPQVVYKDVSLRQDRYLFKDGMLYVQSVTEPYYKARKEYLSKLVVSANTPVSEIYDTNVEVYARAGDYTIGVISYNTNTSIVMIGKGEEARCNIVAIMGYR